MAFLANHLASVGFLGHHAVFADHIQHVAYFAALTERAVAVHADKLGHFFHPGIANHEHFREIEFFTIHT